MIFTVVSYIIVDLNFTPPAEWLTRMEAKCGALDTLDTYNDESLITQGLFTVLYGAYLGIIIQSAMKKSENTTANFW